jgi:copper homeostasis protein
MSLVEICVDGIASALAAARGGANRVELCADLSVGGITPSAGAIAVVCRRLAIPVHVLIRPRGGSFRYSRVELEAMLHDITVAKSLGASAVVLGVLDAAQRVDRIQTTRLVEAARPMTVTFHKAFDDTRNTFEALDDLRSLGIDRVLTSGCRRRAVDGLTRLRDLQRLADDRIVIMPGGGITASDIPILRSSGFTDIHIGSAASVDGITKSNRVRRLVDAARATP